VEPLSQGKKNNSPVGVLALALNIFCLWAKGVTVHARKEYREILHDKIIAICHANNKDYNDLWRTPPRF
jgi:hypothetical protein